MTAFGDDGLVTGVDSARRRALELVEAFSAATGRPVSAAVDVLAVLLAVQAREHGCRPQDVPLEATGYLLEDSRRVDAYLDMMANGLERTAWRAWRLGPAWSQSLPYRDAAQVVFAGWLAQVGRARIGDRVLVMEEVIGREAPWRGQVIGAAWHLLVQDQLDSAGDLVLPSEPYALYVLPAPDDEARHAAVDQCIHPSNVLLDPDHYGQDTADANRAHAMMIHAVISDLRLIEMLIDGGRQQDAKWWLTRLQSLYAALPMNRSVRSTFEDLARHTVDADLALKIRRAYIQLS